MDFIKKNFQFIVIVAMAVFIFFYIQKNGSPAQQPPITVVFNSDTTHTDHKGETTIVQPGLVGSIPYPVDRIPPGYVPSANIDSLKAQYERLLAQYFVTNVQEDSTKIDSIGSVSVKTFTSKNKVDSFNVKHNIRERTITNTVTITKEAPKTRKVLIGGGMDFSPSFQLNSVSGGFLYQNRKDQVFGVGGRITPILPQPFSVEVKAYVPIRLKKKK